jgi:hypothetical protein
MKKNILILTGLVFSAIYLNAQNVGIGEINPTARLTVKPAGGLASSLIVKTFSDDTAMLIRGNYHYFNGFSNIPSSLVVDNKNTLPADVPQLTILASGERSGIFSNGSQNIIDFKNLNSSNNYSIRAYTGAEENFWYLSHDKNATSKTLLSFKDNGLTGMGTFNPLGKLHITHRSNFASPTLFLFDSTANGGPIVHMAADGALRNWQIQGKLDNAGVDQFNISSNANVLTTVTHTGNYGIGTTIPQFSLHVHKNSSVVSYGLFTNSSTGALSSDGLLIGVNSSGQAIFNNQESTKLYLATAGLNRLTISETGNVGIGVDPPTEKLDISGTVKVSGEVNRTATGASNLLPIAYGNISSVGAINSGSGNISITKLSTGLYQVGIANESYHFQLYTTIVTAAGNVGPISTNTSSGGGNLYVYTYNAAGVATDSQFCFVVYKQ